MSDEEEVRDASFGYEPGYHPDEIETDPVVLSLFQKLPKPGTVWPEAEREVWLSALMAALKLAYKYA